MTQDSPKLLTYTHGLVSPLPPSNYSRVTMNVIDHIYISILPRSAHTTIRKHLAVFITRQQRAHEHRFPRSRITPHIILVYWYHAKSHAKTQPDLLEVLNCLRPSHDMKLHQLILKAGVKVSINLLQRARNAHTISEAFFFNRTRTSNRLTKGTRSQLFIPEPCGIILVQTLLPATLRRKSDDPPTNTPTNTAPQRLIPCKHDHCRLYTVAKLLTCYIICRALFCPVC